MQAPLVGRLRARHGPPRRTPPRANFCSASPAKKPASCIRSEARPEIPFRRASHAVVDVSRDFEQLGEFRVVGLEHTLEHSRRRRVPGFPGSDHCIRGMPLRAAARDVHSPPLDVEEPLLPGRPWSTEPSSIPCRISARAPLFCAFEAHLTGHHLHAMAWASRWMSRGIAPQRICMRCRRSGPTSEQWSRGLDRGMCDASLIGAKRAAAPTTGVWFSRTAGTRDEGERGRRTSRGGSDLTRSRPEDSVPTVGLG